VKTTVPIQIRARLENDFGGIGIPRDRPVPSCDSSDGSSGCFQSNDPTDLATETFAVPAGKSLTAAGEWPGPPFTKQILRARSSISAWCALFGMAFSICGFATPANKAALERHYDRFLSKTLDRCTTCHLPSANKNPVTLDEFPHNTFGNRLRLLGEELKRAGAETKFAQRLTRVADEDSDGDGASNELELLLSRNPGDGADTPAVAELKQAEARQEEFKKFLTSYRWQPFEPVQRPPVPQVKRQHWVKNPIDAFVAAEHERLGLKPRPEASKEILLRRVYLDLIGLSPTPEEQSAFLKDPSPRWYEKVVDRLLADPRYGERWGRHWMDVWRYSDWAGWSGGNQIRDSKPHIWRWRDWIVDSLNEDEGYDQMILNMLAADERLPGNSNALRATGFLVRNYKMLSREQWLEDTIKHTSQAFLGITMGCAKCHDHMFDPISQQEYYAMRAIFEPHHVRTDRVPGEVDLAQDGLVYAYDKDTNAPTYFFIRGDERKPDTNRVILPDVPKVLGGSLAIQPHTLPRSTVFPDRRGFVIRDLLAASEEKIGEARQKLVKTQADGAATPGKVREAELAFDLADAKHGTLLTLLRVERIEEEQGKDGDAWKNAAQDAVKAQRRIAVLEAELKAHQTRMAHASSQTKADEIQKEVASLDSGSEGGAKLSPDEQKKKRESANKAAKELENARKKMDEAEKALASAKKEAASPLNVSFKPRTPEVYPATTTGRRTAFAHWVADTQNPLTVRVAMNHIWLRHFGRGIVPTPADFGRNGKPPSHPELLDWLAAEFMTQGWSMKAMHRLIVTSRTYRLASTSDETAAKIDPDNVYLWRMRSRRLEAEAVRDNLLYVAGDLDSTMGGPDIDHNLGLKSKRRSLYLRTAAEKEVEFLKIFDGANVTECYQRESSVVPQQALALANSELALAQARRLAAKLAEKTGGDDEEFVTRSFVKVLARQPTPQEERLCLDFLQSKSGAKNPQAVTKVKLDSSAGGSSLGARESLILVLFNHNDFVTVR
jgi:hypothetical protein